MNVMIAANLRDKGDDFLNLFKSLCAEMGLEIDEHAAMQRTYLCVSEPMAAACDEPVGGVGGMEIAIALPTDAVAGDIPPMEVPPMEVPSISMADIPPGAEVELPPIPLAAPDFDAQLDAQAQAFAQTSTPDPVELEKPSDISTEVGPCTIISMSATHQVATIVDLTGPSRLEVMTDVPVDNGLLNFWYGDQEYRMPAAADKSEVKNSDHEIKPNTIRIVVQKAGQTETFAALVDVVRGEAEQLVLGFDNI